MEPQEIIDRFGAEILRLWTAAVDYRDDIRISEEILSRLVEAYRRIRNTCRFILGNLSDFDPAAHDDQAVYALDFTRIRERDLEHIVQFVFQSQRDDLRGNKWD